MRRVPDAAAEHLSGAAGPKQPPRSVLPRHSSPRVAAYARGPFVEPTFVTPTDWRWRDARTYRVEDSDGIEYRCLRITDADRRFVGYWAVEELGKQLPPTEWEN